VIELELKGSNFGRTKLKPLPKNLSHKFLNVKTRLEVLKPHNIGCNLPLGASNATKITQIHQEIIKITPFTN
jgi:hypothetical protein